MYHIINAHMMAKVMEIQVPTSTTVDYLLGMDAKLVNCEELTTIIHCSKYFTKLLTTVKIQELRLTKDQQKLDRNDPDIMEVVTFFGAGHLVKATMKVCQTTSIVKERKIYATTLSIKVTW